MVGGSGSAGAAVGAAVGGSGDVVWAFSGSSSGRLEERRSTPSTDTPIGVLGGMASGSAAWRRRRRGRRGKEDENKKNQ